MHRLHGVMCNEDELCWREHLEHLEHLECSGVGNLTSRAMSFLHQSVLLTQPAASISQSSSCTTGNCRKDLIARGCAFGFLHVCLFLCSAFSSQQILCESFLVKFFASSSTFRAHAGLVVTPWSSPPLDRHAHADSVNRPPPHSLGGRRRALRPSRRQARWQDTGAVPHACS